MKSRDRGNVQINKRMDKPVNRMSQTPRSSPELSVGIKRNKAKRNIKIEGDKCSETCILLNSLAKLRNLFINPPPNNWVNSMDGIEKNVHSSWRPSQTESRYLNVLSPKSSAKTWIPDILTTYFANSVFPLRIKNFNLIWTMESRWSLGYQMSSF